MKAINVYFEDKEKEDLEKLKGKKSWREFILELVELKKRGNN
jgi:predicted CopG family antitoxin